jgi:outer membrane protein TolC
MAWRTPAYLLVSSIMVAAAHADDQSLKALPLGLDEAASLAVSEQPRLDSFDAQIRAARASSIAARQLPDPQLKVGVSDWPISTRDALSFTRDSDTQIQVGISQEFPRAEKRRLRGELLDRESDRLRAEEHLTTRSLRRDAALAWLDVWRYERARSLVSASVGEAETQQQAAEIALRSGAATQADYLSSRQEVSRLEDTQQAAEQNAARARTALARWIGDAAFRVIPSETPAVPALPALEVVLTRVRTHPHLAGATATVAVATTNAELAQAAYRPDWRMELSYGNRPAYSDMVSLQVGIDLPMFPGARQDQSTLAALSQREAAESAREDASRQLLAEVRTSYQDEKYLLQRLAAYDAGLLPEGQARIAAALAGLHAGRNQFRDVLDARRAALESRMARLDVQADLLKAHVELTYFGAYSPVQNEEANANE